MSGRWWQMVAHGSCVSPASGPHHISIVDLIGALPRPTDLVYDRLTTTSVSWFLRGSINDDPPHAAASHLTCRGASRRRGGWCSTAVLYRQTKIAFPPIVRTRSRVYSQRFTVSPLPRAAGVMSLRSGYTYQGEGGCRGDRLGHQ